MNLSNVFIEVMCVCMHVYVFAQFHALLDKGCVCLTVFSAMGTSANKVQIWDGDHDNEDGNLLRWYSSRVQKNSHSSVIQFKWLEFISICR